MSLRAKIFLFTGLILVALTVVTVLLIEARFFRERRRESEERLAGGGAAVTRLATESERSLLAEARALAAAAAGEATVVPVDLERLARSLAERGLPAAEGAGAGSDEAPRRTRWLVAGPAGGLAGDPLLSAGAGVAAAEPLAGALSGVPGAGIWRLGDELLQVAAAPIGLPPDDLRTSTGGGERADRAPGGALLIARRTPVLDAATLRRLTGSEVLLLADGEPLATTLELDAAAPFAPIAAGEETLTVDLAGEHYLAIGRSAAADYGARTVTTVLLQPKPTAAITGALQRDLAILAAAALALALLAAWRVAREITSSLLRSAEKMSEMAQTGRLRPIEEGAAGGKELRLFHEAFDGLLRSLEDTQRERERSYLDAIGAVVVAIDARDNETTGHSFRVARYAVALGERMGLSTGELRHLEWGALLHDIGKIAVPDAVLHKAGPLTAEEWHIIRQHPGWGAAMLADVAFLEPVLDIVYSHQECWDGSGYPEGLLGEEIPLGARIFAVADTYDSITSDRPYRRAQDHHSAVAELKRVAGVQLDPRAVAAFLELSENEIARLRSEATTRHGRL